MLARTIESEDEKLALSIGWTWTSGIPYLDRCCLIFVVLCVRTQVLDVDVR